MLALAGGGLVCLLVINTTLGAASFTISNLQQSNARLQQREQALEQRVAQEESPASIGRQAYRLGLRQQQVLDFLNVRTGRTYTQPATLPGVPVVPGFTP
jgi:hypothetical protein